MKGFSCSGVRDKVADEMLTEGITGKLIGDKGYISKTLFSELFDNGITLITKI